MALITPATSYSGECPFFTLRYLKIYLRSSLGDERISTLAFLHIEGRLMQKMEFHDLLVDFAHRKARRKVFC